MADERKESAGVYATLDDLVRLQHKGRGFRFLPRQPVHSILAGTHASRLRGRGLNFDELRNYLPGDDIRAMDWKASLRTGKPHVRIYTEERDRPAFLVVDQRRGMFFGSQVRMKSLVAAELGALTAWRALAQGDRVGALVFNDEEVRVTRPERSRRNVLRILHDIVDMNRKLVPGPSNPLMLNQVLERLLRLASHDSLIAIIGDFAGADPRSRQLATLMARHNDVIAALVYDPLERTLPQRGNLVFAEGDRRLEFAATDSAMRGSFEKEFIDRVARTKQLLLQRSIPCLEIDTLNDPTDQVRRHLG